MKKRVLTEHLSANELEEQAGNLLQIAELDSEAMKEGRASRSALVRIARDAIIISRLLAMMFNRDWDRVFHIVGNRVLMRFPQADLLHGVHDLIYYLRRYQEWASARLKLTARVLEADEEIHEASLHGDDIYDSRAALKDLRAEAGPSGDSLDAIFAAWTRRCALVRKQQLKIGSAGGNEVVEIEIPGKPQIAAALELRFEGDNPGHEHPQRKVKSSRDFWLVTTVTGRRFLIPVGLISSEIPLGAIISYYMRHSVAVRRWCIVDVDGSSAIR